MASAGHQTPRPARTKTDIRLVGIVLLKWAKRNPREIGVGELPESLTPLLSARTHRLTAGNSTLPAEIDRSVPPRWCSNAERGGDRHAMSGAPFIAEAHFHAPQLPALSQLCR